MMPAAKHLDPVMGIDIHVHIVPPGIPTPLPNPFIGITIDLFDYLPIVGSTVLVNNMHRAQAGTEAKNIPHLPLFGPLVPPAGNEGEMFMGSATVNVDGEPFTYMALPVLSCQTIGFPAMPRLKKPRKTYSLLLPLSIVLPIPLGPPVLVGGPPTISLMVLGMKALFKGLGRAFKGLRKLQKGSGKVGDFFRKVSKKLHKKAAKAMDNLGVPPGLRNKVHRKICNMTGHPVDVATGKVVTESMDYEGFGPFPFVFERVWFSTSTYKGPLGHGWHHNYDLGLAIDHEEGVAVLRLADGRTVIFLTPGEGEEVFDRKEQLSLGRDKTGFYVHLEDVVYRFGTVPGVDSYLVLQSLEDINGLKQSLQYDDRGRLAEIADGGGRKFQFVSDETGRITKILGPNPEVDQDKPGVTLVRYLYSDESDLAASTNAVESGYSYRYENHLLTAEKTPGGLQFYFEYDGNNHNAWCVRTWGDQNLYHREITYLKDRQTTLVKDSLGYTLTYRWSDEGVVYETIDPKGGILSRSFNEWVEVIEETNALGYSRKWTYNDLGKVLTYTDEDGGESCFEYEGKDLTNLMNPTGSVIQREVDSRGRPTLCRNALGHEISFRYGIYGVSRIDYPSGMVVEIIHDRIGNPVKVVKDKVLTHTFKYDLLGRHVYEKSSGDQPTKLEYDLSGQLVQTQTGPEEFTRYGYDLDGYLAYVEGPRRKTSYTYCAMGRISSREEAGKIINFHYDTEGQVKEIQNEVGASYLFDYDPNGNLIRESDFNGHVRHYEFDAIDRVSQVLKSGGETIKCDYDRVGRLTLANYGGGEFDQFFYDKNGNIIEAKNKDSHLLFERDALGRVEKEICNDMFVESFYGSHGLRSRISSSLGAKITVDRNRLGDSSAIAASSADSSWKVRQERDLHGLEIQRSLPGGAECIWKRDRMGRVTEQNLHLPRSTNRHRSYQWSADAQLNEISDSSYGKISFDYDDAGFLSEIRRGGSVEEYRMPDAIGNLFQTSERDDRVYSQGGQLLRKKEEEGWIFYSYDSEGNLVQKRDAVGRVWKYQWSKSGRLESVRRPDKKKVSYTYDVFGRRLTKTFGNRTTSWLWDGNVMLHEWSEKLVDSPEPTLVAMESAEEKGDKKALFKEKLLLTSPANGPPKNKATEIVTWVFEPETFVPMAKLVGDISFSIITDHTGSPIEMINQTGESVWSVERIGATGSARSVAGSRGDCPFRWQGQYVDQETNLHYNRYRYFDPSTACYLSTDPIGLRGGNPTLYSYVEDPNIYLDPLGLKGCEVTKGKATDDFDYKIKVSRKVYPETTKHIDDAIKGGKSDVVTLHKSKSKGRRNRRKSLKGIDTKPGKDRDEWPMAMFNEGGTGASVRHINPGDNRGAGSSIGSALRDLPKGTKVKFEIVD